MLRLVESHFVPAPEKEEFLPPIRPIRRKSKPSLIEKRKEIASGLNQDCTIFGEQALWRAVITQALMDAGSKSTKREAKFHRAQAIAWFSKRNPDFQLVCALAGLEVDYVFEKAHKAIRQDCKWRKDPTAMQKNKR